MEYWSPVNRNSYQLHGMALQSPRYGPLWCVGMVTQSEAKLYTETNSALVTRGIPTSHLPDLMLSPRSRRVAG